MCVDSDLPSIVVDLSQPGEFASGIGVITFKEKWEKAMEIMIMSVIDNIISTNQDIEDWQ